MKHISRGDGRSATAAAAYRSASRIHDQLTGRIHDYTAKRGVISSVILAPSRAPEWAHDTQQLWNEVELNEKRKDARLARENIVALPHELTTEQNQEWLHQFVNDNYVKRGMVAEVSIHWPNQDGDQRNTHAHIMLTDRQVTRNGFKKKKARSWNDKATLLQWREAFADHMNRALETHGHDARVDHRSYKDQNIDREPTQHMGPAANQIERDDKDTCIGEKNKLAKAFNQNLAAMKAQSTELEQAIEQEEKRKAQSENSTTNSIQTDEALETAAHNKKAQPNKNMLNTMKPKDDDYMNDPIIKNYPDEWLKKFDAVRALEHKHSNQRGRLDRELEMIYTRKQTETELKDARQRFLKADNFWGRITGKRDRLHQEIENLQLNLGSIHMRETERINTLEKAQKAERLEKLGPEPKRSSKTDFNRAKADVQVKKDVRSVPTPKLNTKEDFLQAAMDVSPTKEGIKAQEPLRAIKTEPAKGEAPYPLPGYLQSEAIQNKQRSKPMTRMPKIKRSDKAMESNDNLNPNELRAETRTNHTEQTLAHETTKENAYLKHLERVKARIKENKRDQSQERDR